MPLETNRMKIEQHITTTAVQAVKALYQQEIPETQLAVQDTRAEFDDSSPSLYFLSYASPKNHLKLPQQILANTW